MQNIFGIAIFAPLFIIMHYYMFKEMIANIPSKDEFLDEYFRNKSKKEIVKSIFELSFMAFIGLIVSTVVFIFFNTVKTLVSGYGFFGL